MRFKAQSVFLNVLPRLAVVMVCILMTNNLLAGSLTVPVTYFGGQELTPLVLNDNFDEIEIQVTNNDSRISANELPIQSLATGCSSGSYISSIAADGSISCKPDIDTTYVAGSGVIITGNVISSTGGVGTDTLAALNCSPNQIAKFVNSVWICSNDNDTDTTYTAGTGVAISNANVITSTVVDTDTTYTAGTGVSISPGNVISATGGSDTLSTLPCSLGQIAKFNGTSWQCDTDVDTNTTYTAGTGVTIDANNAISSSVSDTLSGLVCTNQQIARFNGSQWVCDADTDTTYSAGTGVTITGTTISASGSDTLSGLPCVGGDIAKYSGTQWVCDTDIDTNTTYTAGTGIDLTVNTFSLPPGYVSVAGHAFTDEVEGDACRLVRNTDFAYVNYIAGSSCDAQASIQLPDNRTLVDMNCLILDNSSTLGAAISFVLRRTNLIDGSSDIVFLTTTSANSAVVDSVGDPAVTLNTGLVDNSVYAYYLSADFGSADLTLITSNLRLYGCRVQYK